MLRIPTMTTMTTATLTWCSCWVSAGLHPWSWREWWWFPSLQCTALMLRIPTMTTITTMTTATLTWSSCWVSAGLRPWSWREWWWFPSGPRRSSWTTPPPLPRSSSGTAAPHCHHDNQSESHRQENTPIFCRHECCITYLPYNELH